MDNLELYNKVRAVPKEALKQITGGRLQGKSDINPMWRIKTLTEQFGACGTGWKYEIDKIFSEQCADGEVAVFIVLSLYYKTDSGWSEGVVGIGGSKLVTKEKSGMYNNDEAYKMALTDAIGNACKALGVAADVYWDSDKTKYAENDKPKSELITSAQAKRMFALSNGNAELCKQVIEQHGYKKSDEVKIADYNAICEQIVSLTAKKAG